MTRKSKKLFQTANNGVRVKYVKLSKQNHLKRSNLISSLFMHASTLPPKLSAVTLWETHVQMYNIVEELMRIESDIKVPLPDRNVDNILKLENWAKENGVALNNCKISSFDGYDYGLLATDNIERDSIITSVPRKLMITLECIKESPLGTLYQEDILLQQLPHVALAIFLLIERFRSDTTSFWMPYFSALPKKYSTCMYFSIDDLKELKGSPTLEAALKMYKNIVRQYGYFWNLFQRGTDEASAILRDVFTFEQYRWAVSTVMTRQNHIPLPNRILSHAIIPVWDFCNHSNNEDKNNSVSSTAYEEELESCICIAPKNFGKGEQISIFYGERSNADFLIHNGFVYPENHHDVLKIKFGISNSDSYMLKYSLLRKLKLPASGEYMIRSDDETPIHQSVLAFVRIFKMNEEQLKEWMNREDAEMVLLGPVGSVSESFDAEVLEYIQTRMNILLKAYPTTLQEDESLYKQKDLHRMKKLMVLMRMTEKRLLYHAITYCFNKITEMKLADTKIMAK